MSERREPSPLPESPYPGIDPFGYGDRGVFFAREGDTRHLFRLVVMYRGVLLYSDSGMGKSSLINAGLIPMALEDGYQPERIRVQPRPNEEITIERVPMEAKAGPRCLPSIFARGSCERTVLSPRAFLDVLAQQAAGPARGAPRPLLIFDQFEEWVTLFEDAAAANSLAAARASQESVAQMLAHLLVESTSPVKVLIALREDYLAKLSPLLERCPNLSDQYLRLGPLRGNDIRRVIRDPFERWKDRYDPEISPALTAQVVEQFEGRSGAADVRLTELQIVCRSLFEAGRRGQDMEALFRTRGVQGLLEGYLEHQLTALEGGYREAAVALLSRMVTSLGTRKVVAEEDLVARVAEEEHIPRGILEQTLEQLERQTKIIRRDRRRDVYYYEIASEFLIPWIGGRRRERETLVKQRALEQAEAQLQRETRRAEQLEAAERAAREKAAEARQKARQSRRRARLAFALAGVATIVAGLAVWLYFASASRGLAASALNKLGPDPELSLLLALQAVSIQRTSEAIQVLDQSLRESRVRSTLSIDPRDRAGMSGSADGKRLATFRPDNTVEVWQVPSGSPPIRVQASGDIAAIALDPSGTRLVVARRDGEVTVWEAPFAASRLRLAERVEGIKAMAFSPDGRLLATTAAGAGTVRLWDAMSGAFHSAIAPERGERPAEAKGAVVAMGFSPRAAWPAAPLYLATVTASERAHDVTIWNVERRSEVARFALGAEERVNAISVDPRARRVAIAVGRTARVRDLTAAGVSVSELRGHGDDVRALAFSPDGNQLATASADRTARIWDVVSGQEMLTLRGHPAALGAIGFSPDGALTTASADGSVRVWDEAVTRHATRARAVALSGDETTMAAAGDDGTLRLWRLDSAAGVMELRGRPGQVIGIVFPRRPGPTRVTTAILTPDSRIVVEVRDLASGAIADEFATPGAVLGGALAPDATHLAALEFDGSHTLVRVWELASGKQRGAVPVEEGVRFVALSADGRRLATGRDRRIGRGSSMLPAGTEIGAIEVSDVAGGKRLRTFTQPEAITGLALSPDGRRVAAASADRSVRAWDIDTGTALMPGRNAHGNDVGVMAFSRDGRWLATGSADHTMQLWDLPSGRPASLFRHRGPLDAVSFGDSGTQVATCSLDSVAVTPLAFRELVRRAEMRATRRLSAWECREYLGPMRFWLAARAWWTGRGQPCA
jgi:WD40 repeat protein